MQLSQQSPKQQSPKNLFYKLALTGMIAIIMTGCASNPYQTYDNTKTGAFIGATIGALAKSDGNRDDIAKGIAAGAAAGAGAGYVADRSGY